MSGLERIGLIAAARPRARLTTRSLPETAMRTGLRIGCLLAGMLMLAACTTTAPRPPSASAEAPADLSSLQQEHAPAPAPPPAIALIPAPAETLPLPQPRPDMWTRFRDQRVWPVCEPSPGVERWIHRYAGSPERFANNLRPLLPAMDYVLTQSELQGLPSEVMLVPLIESYYRPDARGPGGALGLWQLMPDTARRFGLGVHGNDDERLDLQSSTEAAMRLLSIHAQSFPTYPRLIFAAYNAGGYRVRKALAGREFGPDVPLEQLGLSRTTRDYLDKIKALGCLFGDPGRFDLHLPDLFPGEQLTAVSTPFPIDPERLAERIGMEDGQIRRWNQQAWMRRATTPERPLLLPSALAAAASSTLASGELPVAKARVAAAQPTEPGQVHKVQAGDSLWTISRRYRVRLADLMHWNGLGKRSVLRIGQVLRLGAP